MPRRTANNTPSLFAEEEQLPKPMRRERQVIPAEQLADLHLLETELYKQGYRVLAGLDEAGRGPLAGPVVAGCAVFAPDTRIDGVTDSKKLTAQRREQLFVEIQEKALAWSVALATPAEIDSLNILQATKLAMTRCLQQIRAAGILPDYLLLDALELPNETLPQAELIKGDARSFSIAAASILAKVTRDRIMIQAALEWPMYGFEQHKGYPTKAHYAAIAQHGPTPIHRTTFLHI